MLTLSPAIATRLSSPAHGATPALWVEIDQTPPPGATGSAGYAAALDSQVQWAGVAPYNALDSGVRAEGGRLILGPGSPVTPTHTTGPSFATSHQPDLATLRVLYHRVSKTDTDFYGAFATVPTATFTFIASADGVLNELRLECEMHRAATQVLTYPSTIEWPQGGWNLECRILDASGGQVGLTAYWFRYADVATTHLDALPTSTTPGGVIISGFAASLRGGSTYSVEFRLVPDRSAVIVFDLPWVDAVSWIKLWIYGLSCAAPGYWVPSGAMDPAMGFPLTIAEVYQPTGTAYRPVDLGGTPTGSGSVSWTDTIPIGGAVAVSLYSTNDPVVYASGSLAGWTAHGAVATGDPLHALDRYWLAKIDLTASAAHDASPSVQNLIITFAPPPLVLGSYAGSEMAIPAIGGTITRTSQLTESPRGATSGEVSITVAPSGEAYGALLGGTIKNRIATVSVGYADSTDRARIYRGRVWDVRAGASLEVVLRDDLDLTDRKIPDREYGPTWSATTDYAVGDKVTYGNAGWSSLVASGPGAGGAVIPGSNPVVWQSDGTAWRKATYPVNTHLADLAFDLLTNWLEIPEARIDPAWVGHFKTTFPSRQIEAQKTIDKPTSASDLLASLAALLEAQWTVRDGLLTLFQIPRAGAPAVETITPDQVGASALKWRRGWEYVRNVVTVATGWDGQTFGAAYSVAESVSVAEYGAQTEVIEDKWGLPAAECQALAATSAARKANGMQVIEASVSSACLRLEAGDVVRIVSAQLPLTIPGRTLLCYVVRRDFDWARQSCRVTLLELT